MKLIHRRKGFTVVENEALLDPNLSMRAKGLLAILLSRPEGWDFRIAWLVKVSKDGRDAVRSTIKELEEAGYLVRKPVKDPNTGQWAGHDWELVSPSGREVGDIGESVLRYTDSSTSGTASPHIGAYRETGVGETVDGQSGRRAIRPPGSSDALKKKEVIKTEKTKKEKKKPPPTPPKTRLGGGGRQSAAPATSRPRATKRKETPSRGSQSSSAAAPEVPEWIPEDLWDDWVRYRKEIGKPLTPTSIKQQIRYLEQWRGRYGAEAALDSIRNSITRGWRGLFEPKPERVKQKITGSARADVGMPEDKLRQVAGSIMRAFNGGSAAADDRPDADVVDAEWKPALGDGQDGAAD